MEVQKEEKNKKGKMDIVIDVMIVTTLTISCISMIGLLFLKPPEDEPEDEPETDSGIYFKTDRLVYIEKSEPEKKEIDPFEFN